MTQILRSLHVNFLSISCHFVSHCVNFFNQNLKVILPFIICVSPYYDYLSDSDSFLIRILETSLLLINNAKQNF